MGGTAEDVRLIMENHAASEGEIRLTALFHAGIKGGCCNLQLADRAASGFFFNCAHHLLCAQYPEG